MITLNATLRTEKNLADMRTAGNIPAVVYGSGISDPVSIVISREDFKRTWREAGSSSAIHLIVDGKTYSVLIHDYQINPGTDMVIHADFLSIDMNTEVTVSVALDFVGVSPAVKSSLGSLEKMLHEISVECLPKDLPHNLSVDISSLENVHDQIHVRDIVLPAGVVIKGHDGDDVVAVIAGAQEEVESSGEIDFDSIEVEQKGKKEEEPEQE